MRLTISSGQAAELSRHMRHGWQLLARVERETFEGGNGSTSGALHLVFVAVPAERLDAVRAAIAGEQAPKGKDKPMSPTRHAPTSRTGGTLGQAASDPKKLRFSATAPQAGGSAAPIYTRESLSKSMFHKPTP